MVNVHVRPQSLHNKEFLIAVSGGYNVKVFRFTSHKRQAPGKAQFTFLTSLKFTLLIKILFTLRKLIKWARCLVSFYNKKFIPKLVCSESKVSDGGGR